MDINYIWYFVLLWLIVLMSTESLNRTSHIGETPDKVVNVDVLKQRLIQKKKKENFKRTIVFSAIFISLGMLTLVSY